jgi:hypothetical protein
VDERWCNATMRPTPQVELEREAQHWLIAEFIFPADVKDEGTLQPRHACMAARRAVGGCWLVGRLVCQSFGWSIG